ncbi:cupin [Bacillus sp. 31A1R]|uniref:Cupin n=1 Tax=Robertmurraya mangrovi TaxID=3098077 RepID=A0ABU5IWI0_9BACI|nr:cupin [Bacillus sp. 31A1R]MDZ5471504.1 cupin [Bacillus sp. 31A1R]
MIIYNFSQEVGNPIQAYGSSFDMSRIGVFEGKFHIGCMHLGEDGLVGRHDATSNQLFLVIEGEGWVSGPDHIKLPIKAGQAAFWVTGENHESGTENMMKAVVIEGDNLNPEKFMPVCNK